ncbi:MAG: PorP/SprF family type IX secretion system membrane protein [Chitinophagales bacterium]
MNRILLTIIIAFSFFGLNAQDIHFSQYNAQPLLLNPAMTGFSECDYRIGGMFRAQWFSISGGNTYRTTSIFADMAIFKATRGSNFLGAGISFYTDQAGDLNYNTNKVDLSLAYHIILDRNTQQSFSVGLQGGFAHRGLDQTKAIFQYDAVTGEPVLSNSESLDRDPLFYGDVGIGLMYSIAPKPRSSYYFGFAIQHLNQPNISGFFSQNDNEKQYMKFTGHFGSSIPLSDQLYLQPGFMLLKQGPSFEATISNYVKYKFSNLPNKNTALSIGVMYRVLDAVVAAARLDIKGFTLNVSYDVNVSKLTSSTSSNGGPEVGLTYTGCLKKQVKQGYCPDF